MKKALFVFVFTGLQVLGFGQIDKPAIHPPIGNGSLGQSYILNNVCGLNYVIAGVATTTRSSFQPGNGFPVTDTIKGIPLSGCLTILKAFLYYGVSYTEASVPTTNVSLTNPSLTSIIYPSTIIGTGSPKGWGETGTAAYRAEVTSSITGNGNYVININGLINPDWEVDGVTLVIIYSSPALYSGSISIWDGQITMGGGGLSTQTLNGFSVCGVSGKASAFASYGDMQNNLFPNNNADRYNGTTGVFPNKMWNTNILATTVISGQNSTLDSSYINTNADGYSWILSGLYWQNTNCVACHADTTPINVALQSTDPSACNYNNGSITATATGGVRPYTYLWSPGGNTDSTATGLSAGSYTVIVTDSNGCGIASATINSPFAINASVNSTNISCHGSNNGAASANVTGGVSPYTYLWTGGRTTAAISGLSAGTYTLTVRDNLGCISTTSTTIIEPATLSIKINSHINASCYNGTGSAIADSATGGTKFSSFITTIAGDGIAGYSGDKGPATSAELNTPEGIANDAAGNIYIADRINNSIRKVTPSGAITTIAGTGIAGFSGDGFAATSAALNTPVSVVVDVAGNIFIADQANNRVRKINTAGIITTLAGNGTVGYNGDGFAATAAELNKPGGVAVDDSGNVYIGDFNNNRIRKINTSGIISTIAGNGFSGFSGDGGPAITAELNSPQGILIDHNYNIFFTDNLNHRVRKINTSGTIITIAGTGTAGYNGDGIAATSAELNTPKRLAIDTAGNIFITDELNNRVREVNTSGIISTVVGNGIAGYNGDGMRPGLAELNNPVGIAIDDSEYIYVSDKLNNRIRKANIHPAYSYRWTPSGGTNLIANNLLAGNYAITVTDANGCEFSARVAISQPNGLRISTKANTNVSCNGLQNGSASAIIIAGTAPYTYLWSGGETSSSVSGLSAGTYTLQVSNLTDCAVGTVTITQPQLLIVNTNTIGNISCNGLNNGSISANVNGGTQSYKYLWNNGKTTDTISSLSAGNYSIVVTDKHGCSATSNFVVTQPALLLTKASAITNESCNGLSIGSAFTTTSGGTGSPYNISTIAGNGSVGSSGDGNAAINAEINNPQGVAVDKIGNIYVADVGNNKIRRIDTNGIITTFAGIGIAGYNGDGIQATSAYIAGPVNIATDQQGNVYIADAGNNRIRMVNTAGIISTIAGDGFANFSGDGNPAINSEINNPGGVAVDDSGNIYIGDAGNNRVRRINTSGIINTIAGIGVPGFGGDGFPAINAQLNSPQGVAVDDSGNVFIADANNQRIRMIDKSGIVGTFAGNGVAGYNGDNIPAPASELNIPKRIAVDHSGNLFIGDINNNRVRKVDHTGIITTIAGSGVAGYNGDKISATIAQLNNPGGVALDNSDNLYICDKSNQRLRKVLPAYTYVWSPGGKTDPFIYNLSAQTYTVTATDSHGCIATSSVTITQPFMLIASNTFTNVSCNGVNNGTATTIVNGGTTPYNYNWTNGRTTSFISGLSAGTYSVTVVDTNGCSATSSVTITQPLTLVTSASETGTISCYGDATGATNSSVSGGTLPYTYSWTGGGTASALSGLTAGTYVLNVTDGNGCEASASVTITQAANPLAINIASQSNILCNGGATASIIANAATGGTAPYIYYWSPSGGTNTTATGLSVGTYTIIAIDSHLCLASASVTITEPNVLSLSPSVIAHISCHNNNSGSAIINTTGGTIPYTYAWSNSGSNALESGLSAGTYSILVTDNNGCNGTTSLTITQPDAIGVSASVTSTISCNGGSGSAAASATGGTLPYTYAWSNSMTTAAISGLGQGTYTIIVSDSCGDQATTTVTITQPNPLVISIASQNNVLCNGGTGNVTANTATGGTPPYQYNWSPSGGTTTTATGLSAGTYSITVKDANGCSSNASVTITQPAILTGSSTVNTNVNCSGSNEGSASESISGGTSPYTYSWSNSFTAANVSGLMAGTYTVTVTDLHGCTKIDSVTITEPPLLTVLGKDTKNVNCNDSASGSVEAIAAGGTPPYTYNWSGGGTNSSQTGLTSGTYTITLTDSHGCLTTATATVKQTTAFNIVRDSVMDIGTCTGVASIKISGGTQPYTFLWTPGNQTTDSIYGLCAGVYCCHISDSNNCQEYICMTIKTTVGIPTILDAKNISIYPDPNRGYFTVTGLMQGQVVELYDCLGQKLNATIANDVTLQVDISLRPDAVYLIRIRNKDGSFVYQRKIVKTK